MCFFILVGSGDITVLEILIILFVKISLDVHFEFSEAGLGLRGKVKYNGPLQFPGLCLGIIIRVIYQNRQASPPPQL